MMQNANELEGGLRGTTVLTRCNRLIGLRVSSLKTEPSPEEDEASRPFSSPSTQA